MEEKKNTPEDEKWDKAEEWFLATLEIPTIKQKLQVWQFKFNYPDITSALKEIYG